MSTNNTTPYSSEVCGNGRGRQGYTRCGRTQRGSFIGSVSHNNNEYEGQDEDYEDQAVDDNDEEEWNDEETKHKES
jgi:hypothetical protein